MKMSDQVRDAVLKVASDPRHRARIKTSATWLPRIEGMSKPERARIGEMLRGVAFMIDGYCPHFPRCPPPVHE